MPFKATENQKKAINAKGNILVSAAAGSGKTAVLVERVISKLCDSKSGISADKLLIVTFTNAAAAEMRSRIEKRLDEEIKNNPNDTALLLQKHLLPSAKICTIDSFCIDLVRENFEKLGIEPDFKISDGASLTPINNKVLNEIVTRYFEENNPLFSGLLDILGCEFDENRFLEFVNSIYDYSRQLPEPEIWFKSLPQDYKSFDNDNIWYKYSLNLAYDLICEVLVSLENAITLASVNEKVYSAYYPVLTSAIDSLNQLKITVESNEWNTVFEKTKDFSLPSLPVLRGVSDIFEVSAVKEIYKSVSSKTFARISKLIFASKEQIQSQFDKIYPLICLLSDILIEYQEKLFESYCENNTFTFHNTEHLALKLLCEENNGKIVIKESAKELLDRFDEVLVDEYQDTNDLQDRLFIVLSNFEKKLFVVGDVKQSIYGFRGANPKNFLFKKNKYLPIDETDENSPQKIILGNNFRCKNGVCDFVNYFFKMFMTKETGDIVYNSEEELVASANFPENEFDCCEAHIISSKDSIISDTELEAVYIADYIKKVMSQGEVIKETDDTLRKARYSDFAILLRSAKLKGPVIAEELKRQGIPVSFSTDEFAERSEISLILNLLKVIDNPENDVELLSVMMSPIYNFTPEDMANIRILKRDGNLFSAVILNSENGNEKAKKFLEDIEKLRLYAVTNTLQSLISHILNTTGYLDIVTSLDDGENRRNNLLMLDSYAGDFSADSNGSIDSFIKFITKHCSGAKGNVASSDGSVRIMSIHASKGLQFPICIVAGLGAKFNDNEARDGVIFKTDFGIGFKYFDEETKTPVTTVSRESILDKVRSERLEEELRLFYVAVTRTQDRLVLLGSVSDIEKKADELKTWLYASNGSISTDLFSKTKSYLEWVILSLLLHKDGEILRGNSHSLIISEDKCSISLNLVDAQNITDNITAKVISDGEIDYETAEKIKKNTGFIYPFSDILQIESKASVSKLANSAESVKYSFSSQPSFVANGGITATGRGTAMHKVMQFFDFTKWNSMEEELQRLYEYQFISETEYESLNISALESFFNSEIFSRIINSKLVKREMRFLTEMSASKIKPDLNESLSNEKIIVQGAVDICFEEEDGIVILDFKTDRVDDISVLKEIYGEQLNIYALACEKIFVKKIKQKIIYSFSKQDIIEV